MKKTRGHSVTRLAIVDRLIQWCTMTESERARVARRLGGGYRPMTDLDWTKPPRGGSGVPRPVESYCHERTDDAVAERRRNRRLNRRVLVEVCVPGTWLACETEGTSTDNGVTWLDGRLDTWERQADGTILCGEQLVQAAAAENTDGEEMGIGQGEAQ